MKIKRYIQKIMSTLSVKILFFLQSIIIGNTEWKKIQMRMFENVI